MDAAADDNESIGDNNNRFDDDEDKDEVDDNNSLDTNNTLISGGKFDVKGFGGYLAPYVFAAVASIVVTVAFFKFVLLVD